jgi:hypothetical protein
MAIANKPFKIDGVAIPTPTEYKYSEEDLSTQAATGRTLDGIMHKDVVAVKTTYECSWKNLSWTEAAQLLSAVRGKTKVRFTHADPTHPNEFITGYFYIGKREGLGNNLRKPANAWKDIKMTFIEI